MRNSFEKPVFCVALSFSALVGGMLTGFTLFDSGDALSLNQVS